MSTLLSVGFVYNATESGISFVTDTNAPSSRNINVKLG